jgi:hypothetical protein
MIVELMLLGFGYLLGEKRGQQAGKTPAQLPWPQEGKYPPAKTAPAAAPGAPVPKSKPHDKPAQHAAEMERAMDPVQYDADAMADAMNQGK